MTKTMMVQMRHDGWPSDSRLWQEAESRTRYQFERHGRIMGDIRHEDVVIQPHPYHTESLSAGLTPLDDADKQPCDNSDPDDCTIKSHWHIDPGGPARNYRAEIDADAICPLCNILVDKPIHEKMHAFRMQHP